MSADRQPSEGYFGTGLVLGRTAPELAGLLGEIAGTITRVTGQTLLAKEYTPFDYGDASRLPAIVYVEKPGRGRTKDGNVSWLSPEEVALQVDGLTL